MPSDEKIENDTRHETTASTPATRSGVNAPPHLAPSQRMLWPRTFSSGRSQIEKARVRFGKQPASPIPKRNRTAMSEPKLQVQPVAAVKRLHHSTTRTSVFRGPNRSPSHPVGISNSAYAKVNALKIHPTASSCAAPTS